MRWTYVLVDKWTNKEIYLHKAKMAKQDVDQFCGVKCSGGDGDVDEGWSAEHVRRSTNN